MTTQIKVLNENVIKALSGIKSDNISIAGIAIERRTLLEALKLQTQHDAGILTINYGELSWHYDYQHNDNNEWKPEPFTLEPKPCIQISCDHTVMRFFHNPKIKGYKEPDITPLNFTDHRNLPELDLSGVVIDPQELIKALNFVLPCVALDDSRPPLKCILFESGDNAIKLIAADGFRLGIDKVNAKGILTSKVLIQLADIPKLLTFLKSVKPIDRGRSTEYPEVYLSYNDKMIRFATGSGYINLVKQAGTFPDYSRLIPESGNHIQLIASDMLKAVKALNPIVKDGSGIIRLNFNKYPDMLLLSANSAEVGNSSVECLARVDKPCRIAINGKYLIDYLRTCKDNVIDLFITQESSPMVCHNGIDQLQIIMPMSVQW
ncbi:hypothetical protein LCGC14_0543620 [marine sediment metagenome]|uniref:DNA polymerase III beta sliding clamp C-terminal domain-containing protein n=1 Tax=marine sediment metagenome TaxID=412755 RepID=A0A0F9V0B0_9ZZZZ